MTEDELKCRTKEFALRIIRLVENLPKTIEGRAIANQVVRSGPSVAANYRAACRAKSKADFAAKLGIVVEEADETAFWLDLIISARILPADLVSPLLDEANQLVAIMNASWKSSRRCSPSGESV